MAMSAPRAAMACAVCAPKPREPPVISATLPLSVCSCMKSPCVCVAERVSPDIGLFHNAHYVTNVMLMLQQCQVV